MDEVIVKRYVAVEAFFDAEGGLTPTCIYWYDGRVFPVDKVLDKRPAASLKAGGQGIRYTVRVCGKETYLFFENTVSGVDLPERWFVEERLGFNKTLVPWPREGSNIEIVDE